MRIDAWLPAAAAARPDHEALSAGGSAWTYAQLAADADAAARRLHARGVRAGDRVALALAPGAAFAVAFHGCLRLGAVVVPVDPRLSPAERAARTAGAALVLDAPLDGPPDEDAPLLSAHDRGAVAVVIHTSGTSAAPRPVELTYGNWEASARASALALGSEPGERWLCALPVAHVGGLSILVRCAIHATTALVHERFDAGAVAAAIAGEGVTIVSVVPTMLQRLLEAGLREPPALRCALVGGGPVPPALLARARAAGVPVVQTYGLTEACSQVTTQRPGDDDGTAGAPLPGTRVEIAPDGEILVAGPTVAPAGLAPDGWLHTGDLGTLDERGRLTVVGRRTDTIVTGGENVAPAEVEAVLLEHPAVAEAAVHGRADREWGEAVVATVVLRAGAAASPEDLREHCAEHLARFKVPKRVEFADELPRTASGKLLRRSLG